LHAGGYCTAAECIDAGASEAITVPGYYSLIGSLQECRAADSLPEQL
jgi:hypothetical protein